MSLSFGSGNPVRVHLFRGRNDGAFEQKKTFDTALTIGATPSSRIHQGALEILVGDHSGHLAILRVAAAGVTISTFEVGPGADLNSMFADVNGDGVADIVDTNEGDDSNTDELIFVTLANPDGGFYERTQLARPRRLAHPVELDAGDFDRDGRLDLIAGDFLSTTLYYYRGNGAGLFDAGVAIDTGGAVTDVAVGDVNRDGRLDLVTTNNDQSVSVIVNGGRCGVTRRRSVRH